MRMFPKGFPPSRRQRPKRRAEWQVYKALAGSDRQGFVYYEWRRGYEQIELDFAVWVEGLGRFALQVKGGHYALIDGDWYLKKREGLQPIRMCPLDEAKLAGLDLHDDISERACTPYNPYVIPVLMFPDMELDPAVEHLARRKGVYVVWSTDDLVADLIAIVGRRDAHASLTMSRIAREVEAVTDGLIRLDVAVMGETGENAPRPAVLSVSVGGLNIVQVRAGEIRLRLGRLIGPGAARKGNGGRPP